MPRRQLHLSFFTNAERIAAVEHVLRPAERDGKAKMELPPYVVRALVEMAKRAPQQRGQGRTPLSQQMRNHDVWTVSYALRRKRELRLDAQKQGKSMRAPEAARLAAEEAKAARSSRLSVDEIVSRMNRRPGRYRLLSDLINNPDAWVDPPKKEAAQRSGTKRPK